MSIPPINTTQTPKEECKKKETPKKTPNIQFLPPEFPPNGNVHFPQKDGWTLAYIPSSDYPLWIPPNP